MKIMNSLNLNHFPLYVKKRTDSPNALNSTGRRFCFDSKFGQNDTNRSRNGKSAVEAQEKRTGRSRSVEEFQNLYRKDTKNATKA